MLRPLGSRREGALLGLWSATQRPQFSPQRLTAPTWGFPRRVGAHGLANSRAQSPWAAGAGWGLQTRLPKPPQRPMHSPPPPSVSATGKCPREPLRMSSRCFVFSLKERKKASWRPDAATWIGVSFPSSSRAGQRGFPGCLHPEAVTVTGQRGVAGASNGASGALPAARPLCPDRPRGVFRVAAPSRSQRH